MNRIRNRAVFVVAVVSALFLQVGPAHAAATWTLQSAGSAGTVLNGVSCPSATSCVAVGYGSDGVAIERWDGATWSVQPAPSPTNEGNISLLNAVSCATRTRCMAVGYTVGSPQNSPLAEQWDGTTWTVTPIAKPHTGVLAGVSCTSAHACTAVGSYARGLPLVLRWNGRSWKRQAAPLAPNTAGAGFTAVSCASATSCTAVGGSSNGDGSQRALIEHWDGTTWTVQPSVAPAGSSGNALLGVSCVRDTTTCVAVGQSYVPSSGTRGFIEHSDGTNWVLDVVPEPDGATFTDLFGVDCPSATACEAVGYFSQATQEELEPLALRWDGSTWSIQSVPSPGGISDTRPYAVSCSSANACTLVGLYFDAANYAYPLAERYS